MKTVEKSKLVRVAVAALLLSMPGLALASPISSHDMTNASTITTSVVAATSNGGLATGPVVSSPTQPSAVREFTE
jgi:hypothetical protein